MEHCFGTKRRGCRKWNASMKLPNVAQRGRVESHRKRLIEDRQEVRVVVDAVFKRAVGLKDLYEERVATILSIGSVTQIASARFEAQRLSVLPHREKLCPGIRYLGKCFGRLDLVDVFARRFITYVGICGSGYRQESGKRGNAKFDGELRFFRGVLFFYSITRGKKRVGKALPPAKRGAPALRQKEANVCRAFAHHDRVRIGEAAPVDVDDEVARFESCERAVHAAQELIVWRPRPQRFAHGKLQQIADPKRRCKRERTRAADSDGMEVERNPHADH